MTHSEVGSETETIVAQATAPGRGGIGIVRLAGPLSQSIVKQIIGSVPTPRQAQYHGFKNSQGETLDLGLVLFFPGPQSFTGDDIVEFHGHGGPVVLNSLVQTILHYGARMARPGEFSERAFLNGKLDLSQAEAIADLIDSSSEQAARSAVRSLEGDFSKRVHHLVEELTELRMYVEAAIDFPDEEVDFLDSEKINKEVTKIVNHLDILRAQAKQGALLREGMHIVIAGKPNAGKSSLLNRLSGRESAIVTDIPGTTRDLLREHILIDGIPLHIIDTAGLRHSEDQVEQEGVRRAWDEIKKADRVLLVMDGTESQETNPKAIWPEFDSEELSEKAITVIRNKIDKTGEASEIKYQKNLCIITLSAKQDIGIELLRDHLKHCVGADMAEVEGCFIARQRHLDALSRSRKYLEVGQDQFATSHAGELLAEDLRQAQNSLGEITGVVTPDDLLGKIFSQFCIGK